MCSHPPGVKPTNEQCEDTLRRWPFVKPVWKVMTAWFWITQILTVAEIRVFAANKPSALLQKSRLMKTGATFFPKVTSDNCPPVFKRKSDLIRSPHLQHSPSQTLGYVVRDLPLHSSPSVSLANAISSEGVTSSLCPLHLKIFSTLKICFLSHNLDLRIN